MKIDSYNIGMESARQYTSSSISTRSVSIRAGISTGGQFSQFSDLLSGESLENYTSETYQNTNTNNGETATKKESSDKDVLEKALAELDRKSPVNTKKIQNTNDVSTQFQKLHQLMIRSILELLFGRRKLKESSDDTDTSTGNYCDADEPMYGEIPFFSISITEQKQSFYTESEAFSFNAAGIVKTSDGQEIDINLSIEMSRSFASYSSSYVSLDALSCLDPLVINLDDVPSGLTDMKFFFDLDADGTEEEVSFLDSNSGFLALDKNGDGRINDGSELFGTKSGDGYKDLAQYDLDGNGWIDENDAVFDELKIWVKDNQGNDCLYSLKDKGVGAIYLNNADTNMALRSQDGDGVNGFIRKTGIFLYENGNVGTTQHVDLVS